MKKIQYKINSTEFAGDMHTPISLYLKLRDLYPQSALLESSDNHSAESSKSFIALSPLASIKVHNFDVTIAMPNGETYKKNINENYSVNQAIEDFMAQFEIEGDYGLFGYTAYDSVKYFEGIPVTSSVPQDNDAPDLYYILYRYTLVFDHFHHSLTLKELKTADEKSGSEDIIGAIEMRNYALYDFSPIGETYSTIDDTQYLEMVRKGIEHTLRGDVFQIVLSRRFRQHFSGDDFAVYRKLRQVNPSPYLFYFDFGGFRIFGSSPETHCKVENGIATIDPIAGTAFRSGDLEEDAKLATDLLNDPKESAEHVMLVDLARNDLSRNASGVKLDFYKEIQYYSHVIHLVSRVSGTLKAGVSSIKAYLDTFPAGTLSGAPKVRAMELINEIEPHNRGIYGGAIGYIGFNGSINHAITIRTFVSRNGVLEFQAGAGIVAKSVPERELQEVNSKLGALSRAIKIAK